MARAPMFEWEGKETDREPKSADWYWALGIIATAAVIAAVLFGNVLLALLVVIAAGTLALHGAKHPPTHRFKLTEHGIIIGNDLHPFSNMRSFSVLEHIEEGYPPLLSIKTHSWIAPHLVVPLEGVDADAVYALFLANVDESEHHPTLADLVAAWIGF